MDDLIARSASDLLKLIRDREISPVELVNAYLRRIENINPQLNAIVTLAPDAISQARKAEAAIMRGDSIGNLSGLPITIKDTIETAGLLSTSGSKRRAQFVPNQDAPAVSRSKDSWRNHSREKRIAQKWQWTTLPIIQFSVERIIPTINHTHQEVRVEARRLPLQLACRRLGWEATSPDRIRIPSHFCGIAGLKPATNRVPPAGQFPPVLVRTA